MKQMGLAVAEFEEAQKTLPSSDRPPGLTTAPRVSGLVKLLPNLGKAARYELYDFSKNWSDNTGAEGGNLALTSEQVPVFQCPSTPMAKRLDGVPEEDPWTPKVAVTDYSPIIGIDYRLGPPTHEPAPGLTGQLGLVDAETITYSRSTPPLPNSGLLRKNEKTRFSDCKDGLSVTILYAESAGRPNLYRKASSLVGSDPTTNRVNGGGSAAPGERFCSQRLQPRRRNEFLARAPSTAPTANRPPVNRFHWLTTAPKERASRTRFIPAEQTLSSPTERCGF